jgi:hypothetical protein
MVCEAAHTLPNGVRLDWSAPIPSNPPQLVEFDGHLICLKAAPGKFFQQLIGKRSHIKIVRLVRKERVATGFSQGKALPDALSDSVPLLRFRIGCGMWSTTPVRKGSTLL